MGGSGSGGFALRTAISGVIGGTASEISGGKFANGTVSGAFVHMFNGENMGSYFKSMYYNSGPKRYITQEEGREMFVNGALKYYGTIAAGGGLLATGRASLLLWSVGASTDIISIYKTSDLTQGAGSLAGLPRNGKSGAIIGAGITTYNNFIRK